MPKLFFLLFFSLAFGTSWPQAAFSEPFDLSLAVYTPEDSALVEHLLAQDPGENDVLFYARSFLGKPFEASTLEVGEEERLVVHLQGFDCATFVETVYALCATKRSGERSFEAFCRNLEQLRYFSGRMDGYLSRLHYFSWWMAENVGRNLFIEVSDSLHFTAPHTVENHYMRCHPEKYKHLLSHPEWVDSIRVLEERLNGPSGFYLPASQTGRSQGEAAFIHDGDLIAFVTKKDGLDFSHLGIAFWGSEGQLHLIHASSLGRQVVAEKKSLYAYLREHPSILGIRLLRLR